MIDLEPPLHIHVPFSVPCAQCRHLVPTGVRGGLMLINREGVDNIEVGQWLYFCQSCAYELRKGWTGQMDCSGCGSDITYDQVAIISLWKSQQQACATCVDCAKFDTESDPPE